MKTKTKTKLTVGQLKNIIEERLSMQSTRRALEIYKLPKYDLSYFHTPEFNEIFNQWDEKKKNKFLGNVVGPVFINRMSAEIDKVVFGKTE